MSSPQNFDEKPITGMNIKLLIQGVLIVGTTMSCYYGIVAKIDNIAIETKYKLEAMQLQINNNSNKITQIEMENTQIRKDNQDLHAEMFNKVNKK